MPFSVIFFIIILVIISVIIDKISSKKHNDFIKTLEGKSIFFSTNKQDFKVINNYVLQNLDENIIQIELYSEKVKSVFETQKIHRFISREKLKKFPIGVKIKNHNVYIHSFNLIYKQAFKETITKETVFASIQEWFNNSMSQN